MSSQDASKEQKDTISRQYEAFKREMERRK